MPKRPPAARATDDPGDDLTRISGIGPAVARRMHAAGIRTYTDLAEHTDEQLAAAVAGVAGHSAARIAAADWRGQARRLGAAGPQRTHRGGHVAVELLLTADDRVERTMVRDDRTGMQEGWPGWDAGRLLSLLGRWLLTAAADPGPLGEPPPPPAADEPPPRPPPLRVLRLGSAQAAAPAAAATTPGSTDVGVELAAGALPPNASLACTAVVSARRLDDTGGRDVPIARLEGVLRAGGSVSLAAAGPPLDPGLYRLLAMIEASPAEGAGAAGPSGRHVATGDLLPVPPLPGEHDPRWRERLLAEGAISEAEFAALGGVPAGAG